MIFGKKTLSKSKKQKLAVFDIDGTIFRSSLFIILLEGLIEKEHFPQKARQIYEREYDLWLNRKGSYEKYLEAMIKAFMINIKGVHYKDFANVAKKEFAIHSDRTYVFSRKLIEDLKKKNYYLLAISQSPKTIVDLFAKHFGFDKSYGRLYEIGPQDKFTGKIIDKHIIENKANILRRVIEKENITLKDSYGIGDTEGDIPMLEMVENPICFNPNQKLYRHAKINEWKVVVERKDVIYQINN